jgi:AraC-like DNA-binding protein/ligand-binding sensor protein
MFRDYQDAFEKSTGLSLHLNQPMEDHRSGATPLSPDGTVSPFCALLAQANRSCTACIDLQRELESKAQVEPTTLRCFAGLCETAVPVRVGTSVIAFLQTGRILLEQPHHREFGRIARELLRLGIQVDQQEAEEAYFASRVLTEVQYKAMIRLLSIFASHLAACGSQLALQRIGGNNPAVARGREIIDQEFREELSLGAVARKVNISAAYFGLLFKQSTGINFVEYVARLRVEKAKILLHHPSLRICEIAFEVGFQSLSQFNRNFQRFAGISPRAYRASQPGNAINSL